MKLIINKDYNYILFHFNNKFYLSVICGSGALYEVTIELTKDEEAEYLKSGESFIDKLATEIQLDSKIFNERIIKNFNKEK